MFIDPISDRSFGFSSVLEATLVAINDVNHIWEFTRLVIRVSSF